MKKKTNPDIDLGQLLEDAQALLDASADIAEEKVVAARQRLAEALDNSSGMLDEIKERALAGAKATDETIREHPYQALGVALGAGLLLGYLLGRRN
jgi:ElaB/YqjD/DUF883 family membrane-anchored ribosome-binding protein